MLKKTLYSMLCAAGVSFALPAFAAYPEKPVKLIVPYAAGSPADALARIVADDLGRRLGQPLVIDNRPGANAMIGISAVAKSAPDGYTIGLATMDTQSINPLIYKKIAYDAARDFSPIAKIARFNMALIARPNLQAKSATDVIKLAREKPGKVSYGTWGLGSLAHLWGMQLERTASLEMLHVPFQGSPAGLQALMGDQLDLMFMLPNVAVQNEKAGKIRILGATSAERLPDFPQIRTLAEQGFPNFVGAQWMGVLAPADSPAPVIQRLNREINALLKDPGVVAKLSTLSMYPEGGSPADMEKTIQDGTAHWKNLLDANKFKPLD